jgi:probable rRNA maturation factor
VPVDIDISIEAGDWPQERTLRRIAERAVQAAEEVAQGDRQSCGELSLLFTNNETIRSLNKDFRGKNKPTNVLSFPQNSCNLLGDVILASETVREEARLAGKPLEDHMAHLIIHGFLHLLGHDHQKDEEAELMEAYERAALAKLGISDPYAAA